MSETTDETTPRASLPPDPWKAVFVEGEDQHGELWEIQDAAGEPIIRSTGSDWPDATLEEIDPRVLRAILGLPALLAAARGVLDLHARGEFGIKGNAWYEAPRAVGALHEALTAIDGETTPTPTPAPEA